MTSACLIILVGWYRPFESAFANNMEIFSEVISLWVLYLMMCFSDFVADPETRSSCGVAFMAIVGLYAGVHIFFLLANVYAKIRHLVRKKYY